MPTDAVVDLVQVVGRYDHVRRESAVDVRADRLAMDAEVSSPSPTGIADPARVEVRLRSDSLTDVVLRPGARLDHTPGDLVAHDHGRHADEFILLDVQVGAADTGAKDLDDDLPGPGRGARDRPQCHVLRAGRCLDEPRHGGALGRRLGHASIVGSAAHRVSGSSERPYWRRP